MKVVKGRGYSAHRATQDGGTISVVPDISDEAAAASWVRRLQSGTALQEMA